MQPSFLCFLTRFARDRRGNVAMIFALALLALCLAAGTAIDYTNATRFRGRMQNAADIAALAASRAASAYISDNGWSAANATKAAQLGVAAANTAFDANIDIDGLMEKPSVNPTMTIASAQSITANIAVTARVPTILMQLAGYKSIDLSTSASAVAALPVSYYQFVFLVDISGSMAIGGTAADIAKMQASKTFNYCGFACHDPNLYHGDRKDYRALAKSNNIKLKIDYVNSAIATFLSTLDTALTKASAKSKTAIYTYATTFTEFQAPTDKLATAIAKAATIDIESVGPASTNWGYTKTSDALTSLKAKVAKIGDGTTSDKQKTYVVFISDALQDLPSPGANYGRKTNVDYLDGCTAIKALSNDLTLITIEPTYPVVPNDAQYNEIVKPYANKLGPTMKSCATSATWAFQAEDGPGIVAAMNNAVLQITSTLRIAR